MRPSLLILAAVVASTLALSDGAEARRLGGGRSFGAQRESIAPAKPTTAPTAAAAASSIAAQPASPTAAIPAAPAAAPAPSGISRWLGPIAGIGAGLGLAALLSHFGFSDGLGSVLLIGLAVVAGVFLLRTFMIRRSPTRFAPRAYTDAIAGPVSYDGTPVRYEPGSDPAWRPTLVTTPQPNAVAIADASSFGVARKPLPAGFDAVSFAREAKRQYIQVQALYDEADGDALANVMTSEMAGEVRRELDERVGHQPTEVISLDADVLDVAAEGDKYWVSVRFTGLVREDGQPVPTSIDEVWNLTKPINGTSGWLLAGISQLA